MTARLCAGTPARGAIVKGADRIMRADPSKAGCARPVVVRLIQRTADIADSRLGGRRLFERTCDVVICPHCDGPAAQRGVAA